MSDQVKNPSHYCDGRTYEPRKVIRDWGLNFNLGNVVKYVSRAGRKGSALEDLMKAKQYLEFEIEALQTDTDFLDDFQDDWERLKKIVLGVSDPGDVAFKSPTVDQLKAIRDLKKEEDDRR